MKKILALISLGLLSVASFAAAGRNIAGTWMVTSNGKANPNMKLIFTPKGAFKFVGSNYSSSGTYKVSGDKIELNWSKVDGQAVKPGTMHRTLNLTPENTFIIDRFTYTRKG